jgi:CHAT domain-containing protein/tetratricopeptide (TPR) repeat protein
MRKTKSGPSNRRIFWIGLLLAAATMVAKATAQSESTEIARFQADLNRAREAHDLQAQSKALQSLGESYKTIGNEVRAIDVLNRALTIERSLRDRSGEAYSLTTLGGIYTDNGDPDKGLSVMKDILATQQQLGDRKGQAAAMAAIGEAQLSTGKSIEAFDLFKQALSIDVELHNHRAEGVVLSDIGTYYWGISDRDSALDYYGRAISRERETADQSDEAVTLYAMGLVHEGTGQPQMALDCYQQAMKLERKIGNREIESAIVHGTGEVYEDLGEARKAMTFYQQATNFEKTVGDTGAQGIELIGMGGAYRDLGQRKMALLMYSRALPMLRKAGDLKNEAIALNDMGAVLQELGDPQTGLRYYQQALPLELQVGDKDAEAYTRWHMASLGNLDCLEEYLTSLRLATQVNDLRLQGQVYNSLMLHFRKHGQPDAAIAFGKEAVNSIQKIRSNIKGLGHDLQHSFMTSQEQIYRNLADILIDQGHLLEAERILRLLKEQEYYDFMRGTDSVGSSDPVPIADVDKAAEAEYEARTSKAVSIGDEFARIPKPARSAEDKIRIERLSEQLAKINKALDDYYTRLYSDRDTSGSLTKTKAEVQDESSNLQGVISKLPHTIGLLTLVTGTSYRIILITGQTMVAREYPITQTELNRKVAALRLAISNRSDVRAPAQDLYRIVIGPVADLLAQDQSGNNNQVESLVWYADGVLRYVPYSVLYDGKKFLVESYANIIVTSATSSWWDHEPTMTNLHGLGLGLSVTYNRHNLTELPEVPFELQSIIRDPKVKQLLTTASRPMIPGTILMNEQFTLKAFEDSLSGKYAVVHIASHFVLSDKGYDQSWLLLGGEETGGAGYNLTLARFKSDAQLKFDGSELVTLSACETGLDVDKGDGSDVDAFSILLERKGAHSVIASLWDVDDESTGDLMANFYGRWVRGAGRITKAEALREAQVDLLMGKYKPKPDPKNPHSLTSFSSPFYWAPFILMGNWK